VRGVLLGLTVVVAAAPGLSCAAGSGGASRGADAERVVVTEKENGSAIRMARGAVLTIRLEAVPGAGYDWKLVRSDPSRLRLLREELEIAPRSMPGSPAHKTFEFLAEGVGPSTVELQYTRPWETQVPPRKTYRLDVEVK
jgi:inhibitor of cysteine peptidase